MNNEIKERDYEKEKELIELKHKYHMIELEYARESEKIRDDMERQRMRIKSAEIRKNIIRKNEGDYKY